jgi:hypothetical protein
VRARDFMIDRDLLAQAVSELDAGTRALLDLSLRRAIPDDQVAFALGVDAASIPPRRARGIAELADKLEVPGPSELAALLLAIPELPDEAWAVPKVAPFSGKVSRARRARAFRRVAIAASPAVALGAVIAALMVSSGSDLSVNGTPTGATVAGGGGGGGAPAAAAAAQPEARHGLPEGSHLASASEQQRRASHRRAARKQHRARRHHAPGSPEHAIQARQPSVTPRTTPVSFTPTPDPAPVGPQTPKHVTHRHEGRKPAPKKPAPAPVQTPSVPVSAPVPAPPQQVTTVDAPETQQNSSLSAPVSKPNKSPKPPVPQPDIHPYGNGSGKSTYEHHHGEGGGGCGHDSYGSGSDSYDSGSDSYDSGSDSYNSSQSQDSYDSGQSQDDGGSAYDTSAHRHSGGSGFSPPGLFKKRYGPGRSGGR